jgi:uncharacterized iron-regulated membrane protein
MAFPGASGFSRKEGDEGTWALWWRRPQSVWLRRAVFQVHLWSGLILGLYIVMLSLTGSFLVYRVELDRWLATSGPGLTAGQYAVLWVVSLHDELLLGRDGQWWNGIGSALVTLLVVTGLVVWWPGSARWRRSIGVQLSGGWRRVTWDLHSALGFWLFGLLLVWGISGFYLGVPRPFTALAELAERPDGSSPVDTVLMWLARLHFGRWRTPWLKATWAVLGLVPAIMFVSGAVMWFNRVVRPRVRRQPALDPMVLEDIRP